MNDKMINIILDLDQTLISSEPVSEFDLNKNKNKALQFEFYDMDSYYIVFQRPHLQTFLDFLFKNFNVSVWTAASKDYALSIIDNIILSNGEKNRKLDFIFFEYHCDLSDYLGEGSKDLSILWKIFKLKNYNMGNSIIIDDLKEIKDIQYCNSINIKPFNYNKEGSERDDELLKIKKKLKKLKEKMKEIKNSDLNKKFCLINYYD